MSTELALLKDLVAQAKPTNPGHVRIVFENYFNSIGWSLLKEEWKQLTEHDRVNLMRKMLKEYKESQKSK